MITEISASDSAIVRQAEELARSMSSDMLFNQFMRCYWFGELFAQQQNVKADCELMFLSATLHDLGSPTSVAARTASKSKARMPLGHFC